NEEEGSLRGIIRSEGRNELFDLRRGEDKEAHDKDLVKSESGLLGEIIRIIE
ncbi:hypothetical protein KI387_007004, partial [Taxus chinensis]